MGTNPEDSRLSTSTAISCRKPLSPVARRSPALIVKFGFDPFTNHLGTTSPGELLRAQNEKAKLRFKKQGSLERNMVAS
ncbi:hypothetical protein ACFX15_040610 [Malus domestica]